MPKIIIDKALCKKDGMCVLSCPGSVFVQKDKDSMPEVVYEKLCISCGHCVAICPHNAISHMDFPQGRIKPVNQELIPSIEQITEMLRTRRSIRAFKGKQVDKELIDKIINAASFAPSSHNTQSTEFVVVQDKAVLSKIVEFTSLFLAKTARQGRNPVMRTLLSIVAKNEVEGVLPFLPEFDNIVAAFADGKDQILHNAPVLLVFFGRKNIYYSDINAILALHNASLVCWGLGLGSFFAGYVLAACQRDKRIPKLLSVPDDHKIYGILALGYPKFKYKNWIERRPPKIKWV